METRQFIYKYVVEASVDGKEWTNVLDESRNADPGRAEGLERWFAPMPARYVRLTVIDNSAAAGVQLVELEVRGPDRARTRALRTSIVPPWQISFPEAVADASAARTSYLMELSPTSCKPGWMPAGKTWPELNGWVRLYADYSRQGSVFTRSLYGESVSEIVYAIPEGTRYFAAVAGFGAAARDASVEFQVFVDGDKRHDSGLYRFGRPLLPVVVDVASARELKLVVTDGGDGLRNDYAWWGDARFIR